MSQQPVADQLSQLKHLTTVVADSGDFAAIRQYQPQDATTNPSLILKAIQQPQYLPLAQQALSYAADYADGPARIALAADKLAVLFGQQLLQQVPGFVSTEVDARLSFNSMATIEKAHQLLDMYQAQGADISRVLIKVAATWEGIQAARVLEQQGIRCNLTLIFSFAQAQACAEAGAFLISPFVGRILDWYKQHQPQQDFSAERDPGVQFVRRVYQYFKQHGYPTIVMGASFRNTSQITELAGCDRLTISPALLQQLAQSTLPVPRKLSHNGNTVAPPAALTEANFRWQMLEDQMASDKLQEGIRLFAADQLALEQLLSAL
jgi:transaldolase